MPSRRNVCTVHDEIGKVGRVLKKQSQDFHTAKQLRKAMVEAADKLAKLKSEAKQYGIVMENRMVAYYNSIIELGFERTRDE